MFHLIPIDVTLVVIHIWLSHKEMCFLDSAFCNHKERKNIILLFGHEHFARYLDLSELKIAKYGPYFDWIGNRDIKLNKLCSKYIQLNFSYDEHYKLPLFSVVKCYSHVNLSQIIELDFFVILFPIIFNIAINQQQS